MQLIKKFRIILMNSYNKNVQVYISDFYDIYNKLKNISYIIEFWQLNNIFINELKNQYSDFVRTKLNEFWDIKNKNTIIKINLNKLINQIITCVINYHFKNKNKNKKVKFLNADNKINNSKLKLNSNLNQDNQINQVNVNKLKLSNNKEK